MSPPNTTPAEAGPAEIPQRFWGKILGSTPVILTVIATTFAGLSSSEMTRAQYYRALAAQHQAKVSDQWNFFQAKRIRGTSMDMTATLLHSLGEPEEARAETVRAAAERMPASFDRAAAEADRLARAVEAAKGDLGEAADPLRRAAAGLKTTAAGLGARAAEGRAKALSALAGEGGAAFRYLDGRSLPDPEGEPAEPAERLREVSRAIRPELPELLEQVEARRTERQMAAPLGRVAEEEIARAIDAAQTRAADYEKLCEPTNKALDEIEALVTAQATLARGLHRAAGDLTFALGAVPPGDGKGLTEVRLAAAALLRVDGELKERTEGMSNSVKAAHVAYTARRYGREAGYNRFISGLYELQVRKASLESDRHRERSVHLFFAMLAAQAGVTIATFALAVRRRSLLWGLAALAGVAALAIGAYGFFDEVRHALERVRG